MFKKEKENMKQYETVNDEEFVSKNLDTVLNLITKRQKEIEDYKYLYEQALDNTLKAYKENIELKKQINLMINTINLICSESNVVKRKFKESYCEFINSDEDCCWKTDKSCQECIEQYFERKVEEC